jgi:SAM-dependent methyltransferase
MKALNIGSGTLIPEGREVTNIDIRPQVSPDIVWNLDHFPWPVADEAFDEVYALDILEHLEHVFPAMEEIHRALKPDGMLYVHTTYWRSRNSFSDPTHRHFFTEESFDYFDERTLFGKKYGWYSYARFFIESRYIDVGELVLIMRKLPAERPADHRFPRDLHFADDEIAELAERLRPYMTIQSKENDE